MSARAARSRRSSLPARAHASASGGGGASPGPPALARLLTIRIGQSARFVLVGAGGFVLNVCAYTVLFALGTQYVVASASAYLVSNGAMYLGHRYFTFGLSHDGFVAAYLRYVAVGTVVAGLTALLLALLVEGVSIDPRLGQALALSALVPLSFLLGKRWVFRLHPDAP